MSQVLEVAAARIGQIVAATEQASTEIRAKVAEGPEADLQNTTRGKLASGLSEALIERADRLGDEAADLAAVLTRARGQLEASALPPSSAPPTEQEPAPGPAIEPAPSTPAIHAAPPEASKPPSFAARAVSVEPPKIAAAPPPADDRPQTPTSELTPAPEIDQRVSQRFVASSQTPGQAAPFRPRGGVPAEAARPEVLNGCSTEGIRLLATQMAVAGSSRDDIESRLRSEFGVEDASDLLAEVLRLSPEARRATG